MDPRATREKRPPRDGGLRHLLSSRQPGYTPTESPLEIRVAALLERGRLGAALRQFPVRDRGRVVARVDFAYPWARLAIEADGFRFHSGREDWQRDRHRGNELTLLGWRVLRVTSADVAERPREVLEEIRTALQSAKENDAGDAILRRETLSTASLASNTRRGTGNRARGGR